jgi:hypothetical protein
MRTEFRLLTIAVVGLTIGVFSVELAPVSKTRDTTEAEHGHKKATSKMDTDGLREDYADHDKDWAANALDDDHELKFTEFEDDPETIDWVAQHYSDDYPLDETTDDDSSVGDEQEHEDKTDAPHSTMNRKVMKKILQEELLDEQIEKEKDPIKKLQLELKREKADKSALLSQLQDNLYEIDDLVEKNTKCETKLGEAADLKKSFEAMKAKYEQAVERERAKKKKELAALRAESTGKHH